jgi:predicted metalloprotease with PDZ domain
MPSLNWPLKNLRVKNLDDFYAKYINGLAPIDYNKYLGYAGYKITDQLADGNNPTLGVSASNQPGGKKIVSMVQRDGAGWKDGINVGDEIVSVDGTPVTDMTTLMNGRKVGDKITVAVIRDGKPYSLPVTLLRNNRVQYKAEELPNPTAQQLAVRKKWLKL